MDVFNQFINSIICKLTAAETTQAPVPVNNQLEGGAGTWLAPEDKKHTYKGGSMDPCTGDGASRRLQLERGSFTRKWASFLNSSAVKVGAEVYSTLQCFFK